MWKIIILRMFGNILNMLITFSKALPIAFLIGIVIFFILKNIKKKRNVSSQKEKAIIMLGMYISVMLQMAILFRQWWSILEVDWVPFDRYGGFRYIILYGIANVFVFLPVGILVPCIWEKLSNIKGILLIGFLGSLFIELCQLALQCGVCQTEDLIMNSVGAVLGFKLFEKFKNNKNIFK